MTARSSCSISGCDRRVLAKGLCQLHYSRIRKTGSAEAPQLRHVVAGDRYERLLVIREFEESRQKWLCRCDCGAEVAVFAGNLTRGHTKSCGCFSRERVRTHGRSKTDIYKAWTNMLSRCNNPKSTGYKHYGGRGITVCERWRGSFETFLADMGPRPSSKHSVDRINVNGNYEPSNCRWADQKTQTRNTRQNHHVVVANRKMTLAEAAVDAPVPYNTVLYRLKRGWSLSDALTKPRQSGVKP